MSVCFWDALPEELFTKADVDYSVAATKFITVVPGPRLYKPQSSAVTIIRAHVFKRSEPTKPIPGRVVMAKARSAPSGIPKPTPSSCLEWYGKRIRGLNYELWHDNPDGSVVKGW